jgi:hypothetical protein
MLCNDVSLITNVSKPDGALSGLKLIRLDLLTTLGVNTIKPYCFTPIAVQFVTPNT